MSDCILYDVDNSVKTRGVAANGLIRQCFICGGNIISTCRCPRSDSVCENGHESHYCVENHEWHEGHSSHGSSECCILAKKGKDSDLISTIQIKTGIVPSENRVPKYKIGDVKVNNMSGKFSLIKEVHLIFSDNNAQYVRYKVEEWEHPYFEVCDDLISEESLIEPSEFPSIALELERTIKEQVNKKPINTL